MPGPNSPLLASKIECVEFGNLMFCLKSDQQYPHKPNNIVDNSSCKGACIIQ